MNIIGIIPARMESSRYPGKPLAKIHGVPMVGHCYFRSKMCPLLDEVYVATCNQVVVDYMESVRGKAIMTANTHERASDRAAEAMLKAEAMTSRKVDIVVMIHEPRPDLRANDRTGEIALTDWKFNSWGGNTRRSTRTTASRAASRGRSACGGSRAIWCSRADRSTSMGGAPHDHGGVPPQQEPQSGAHRAGRSSGNLREFLGVYEVSLAWRRDPRR